MMHWKKRNRRQKKRAPRPWPRRRDCRNRAARWPCNLAKLELFPFATVVGGGFRWTGLGGGKRCRRQAHCRALQGRAGGGHGRLAQGRLGRCRAAMVGVEFEDAD